MTQTKANGITIAYEAVGPRDGAPILLIHGVGAQLVRWPPELVDGLAAAGFRVIRFDNRDVGLSTQMDEAGVPDLAAILSARARGETPALPYTLSDMANDAVGLLDALGVSSAHVVGVSLGGMIAQTLAIEHRPRVRSMTILMSQSGNPALPPSDPEAMAALATPAPDPSVDWEGFLNHSVKLNQILGSPSYPTDVAVLRGFAEQAAARAYSPYGSRRQIAAGRGAPDRRSALAALLVPSVVIHGAQDKLVPPVSGEELARTLKNCWYLSVGGMGHDLPAQLCPLFISLIAANSAR
jgi:pimeloyl-ACP methyl ester carboxylesterase